MNRIKRFIGILLSSVMTLGVIAAAPFCVSAEGNEHMHNGVSFTAWTASDRLPDQAGSYCLTKDVTLRVQWSVPSGDTNLCLNGHTVTQTGEGERVVFIGTGRTLSLYDCGEGSYLQMLIDTLPDGTIIMLQRNYTAGEDDTALVIP